MPKYKLMNARGGVRYRMDGRIVPTESVPQDIQDKLKKSGDECEDDQKRCIVCLHPNPTRTRFVDMQVVDLCEDDYFNKRMGEVAYALRKSKDGRVKERVHAKGSKQTKKQENNEEIQKEHEENRPQENDGVLTNVKVEADLVKS